MAGVGTTAAQQAARPFWDVERLIGQVRKNDRGEVIQVRHTEKDNRTYVDVRVFYPGGDNRLRWPASSCRPANPSRISASGVRRAAAAGPGVAPAG